MWLMEQKVINFQSRTDIRDEPARPEPARPGLARPDPARPRRFLTTYSSNLFIDTNLKLLHNIGTGLRIVISNFHRELFF